MKILSSLELKEGATIDKDSYRITSQPLQFLSKDRKTLEWTMQNADWWEMQGIRQIKQTGKRLLKNIRLAKGIIERSDYIPDEENEYADVIQSLQENDEPSMDLKFFPIIPNVINILKAEFAKRSSKIMFVGKDDDTYNELLEEKRAMIEKSLLSTETEKMIEKLIAAGMDPESPEFQQNTSPETIKTLPQIQAFFNKDYQSLIAEWATHQKNADERRFNMPELEVLAFESSLTCDREFWHYKMGENDYDLELWDPVFSWIVKSRKTEYFSNATAGGTIDFMSPADIIDSYGYLMNEQQLTSMEMVSGNYVNNNYIMQGVQNDGSMYDATKSDKWNKEGPSLGMRQFQSFFGDFLSNGTEIDELFNGDDLSFDKKNCLRVSTSYWKSQRRLFHLTRKSENGEFFQGVVDEDYELTDKAVYNTKLFSEKNADSLVKGEHLEAIWNNQTWGVVKIGKGKGYSTNNGSVDFDPIYLGIDNKVPSKLKYQFKGDDSLYGCKLPIEGRIFSGNNTRSICPVDLMKPAQINYNIVNNQISDILIDEIGPVAMIDQNALPKHSLGEDWGPGNYVKASEAMRRFKMLPLDTSTKNLEGTTNFNQYGMLNFDETSRLSSRINLSKHFKDQAMEVIGITPQRMGQIQASETAQGTETAVSNSYAQTEMLFIQHSDWLMPRVHSMRTDLAQYYHSKKPSLRLQYITSMDEKVNFEMNTKGILSRDLGVYCTTSVNSRELLKQLKQFFISNNTAGGNMHDLAQVLKSDSLAEIDRATKQAEIKMAAQQEAQRAHEDKLNQDQLSAAAAEKEEQRAWDANENKLNRESKLDEALVKAAGMPSTDVQQDGTDDYTQKINFLQKDSQFNDKLNFDREKESNKNISESRKESLKREEMNMKQQIADKALEVARVNKNKYDKPKTKK